MLEKLNKVFHLSTPLSHNRKRKLALRKTLLLTTLILAITAIITPPLVSSVQNIFIGFNKITEIWYNGQPIEKVVYQGQTIWEREPDIPVPPEPDPANPTTYGAMQLMTNAQCSTTRGTAFDARNNQTYYVQKIGNLCYMESISPSKTNERKTAIAKYVRSRRRGIEKDYCNLYETPTIKSAPHLTVGSSAAGWLRRIYSKYSRRSNYRQPQNPK